MKDKTNQANNAHDNSYCICGHKINRSHIINWKKTRKNPNKIFSKCKFCDCKGIELDD